MEECEDDDNAGAYPERNRLNILLEMDSRCVILLATAASASDNEADDCGDGCDGDDEEEEEGPEAAESKS